MIFGFIFILCHCFRAANYGRLRLVALGFSCLALPMLSSASPLGKDIYSGIDSMFGPTVEDRIRATVFEANKSLPKMIASDLRLDPAIAGPGKRLTYNYTVMSRDAADQVTSGLPELKRIVCSDKNTKFFLSKGATVVYSYKTESSLEFARLIVMPSECQ